MKEVACAVCGALHRFPAAEIPATGKTVTCTKCKARIVVPPFELPMTGGTGDVIDLADLPAPRRAAPPAARTAAAEAVDLPAPKGPRPSVARPSGPGVTIDLPTPKGPARPRAPEPLTLDSIDLVAPVGPVARAASVPGAPIDLPTDGGAAGLFDNLPAPKGPPKRPPPAIPPLPPKASAGVTDLLTPKSTGFTDLPAPRRAPGLVDLPAPKASPLLADLPAPKRPSARGANELFDDLPAPKGPVLGDLPAPKRPSVPDLVAPKRASADGSLDLPAPKGFFDDLPQPARPGTMDLPAPKGFFDDLPQPARPGTMDLPAPKGFFEDLPGPTTGAGTGLAPKGYYADLPQSAGPAAQQQGTRADRFDDQLPSTSSAGISLDSIDLSMPTGTSGAFELQTTGEGTRSLPRASEPPPALELLGDGDPLGLDLPNTAANPAGPAPARGSVVSFKPGGSIGTTPSPSLRGGPSVSTGELDLAVPTRRESPSTKSQRIAAEPLASKAKLSSKTLRVVLIAALSFAALGGGGFVMYQRWEAKKERAAEIDQSLRTARKQLAASDRGHWKKAGRTANELLQRDGKNAEAMGLAAQAALAGYLDEGGPSDDKRIAAGHRLLDLAATSGLRHPALDKAGALRDLIDGDAASAIAALQPLAARDPDAALYLGWAQLASQRWAEAEKSFAAAKTARPVTALYGLAQAQVGAGQLAAAHATYLAVIAIDPEHVPSLVGEAITAASTDGAKRETALLAILQRKGIDAADPRAVVQAWTRAGDDARRAGRLDAARERYRKALALLPADRGALVSAAALELADGKLESAAEASEKALALAPDDVAANLIAAELDLRRNRVPDAAQRLSALRQRQPPIAATELLARLELLDGMRLEAEQNTNAALAAYDRATQVPGNTDVAPTIAAATLLGRLADDAERAKQPDQAKAFRAQADQRLATIAVGAEADPNVAITLGVAYLSAGAPAQAERWLRGAIEKRPSAVEAHYQLAEALRRQGKQDEAVATLVKAFELDPTRTDLGVELARGFEAARRDADAAALYKRLLTAKEVTADVRARAGRFFARTGDVNAARQQGELLLAADPQDAVGLFLRAEGLLADGRPLEARRFMQEAVNQDGDPQLYDGLGRANEAVAAQTGDTAMRDEALRAYAQASEQDPAMLNPHLGAGRLHLARAEYDKALSAYEAALRLAPRNPDIPYGIGLAYAELDDRPRAIEWLTRAVAAQPRADAYWRLGSLYYEIDRAGAAATALERATSLATKDERERGTTVAWLTDALWLLGSVQQVLRNDGATRNAWEAYLARNPSNKAQADEVRRNLLPLRNR